MNERKVFWKSKTFWLNAGMAGLTAATWLTGHQSVLEQAGLTTDKAASIVAIANIALRCATTQPLKLTHD